MATYVQRKHGIAVSNGSAALDIAVTSIEFRKRCRSNYASFYHYFSCTIVGTRRVNTSIGR
ncbi:MAG: hypothetical protein V9E96_01925 [Chitinophagaceae bacterium]